MLRFMPVSLTPKTASGELLPTEALFGARRRGIAVVLVTLWHGLRLAYRPLGPVFNRLLHGAEYVVLNLPGVRNLVGLGAVPSLSLVMTLV